MRVTPRSRLLRASVLVAAGAVSLTVLSTPATRAQDEPVAAAETVTGELVQAWAEPEDHHSAGEDLFSQPLTWIEPETGDAVRIPTDDVQDIAVGTTVEVTVGGEVTDVAAAEGVIEPAREVLAAEIVEPAPAEEPATAEAATTVTNQVTVVMVVAGGGTTDSTTLQQVVDAVNGPVAQFWSKESQGAIGLGVSASHDWITTTAKCTDYVGLWNEVAKLPSVNFTAAPGKHLMLYVSNGSTDASRCPHGLAEVGTGPGAGGRLYARGTATSLVAHEFGHNFSLWHSSSHQCDGTVEGGTCAVTDYNDWYDVMGVSWEQVGSLSAPHAARLGVLPPEHTKSVSVTSSGTLVTLSPTSGRTGTRALRLTDSHGRAYWLEYRTPDLQDAWLGTEANRLRLESGVLLRRAGTDADRAAHGATSFLLDATPSSLSGWRSDLQVALPFARAVPISGTDLTVTVVAASATEATVRVATAGDPTVPTAPTRPIGSLDAVSASGTTLTVRGWALDPNTPDPASAVHLYVDGAGVALQADGDRPDVGAAFPHAGSAHGFGWSADLAPGMHRVCAYAIDREVPSTNTSLGCRDVAVAFTRPTGTWDSLSATGTTVSLSGWTYDPDSPTGAVDVHVYVDGKGVGLVADRDRPDVGAAFPHAGSAHGFGWSADLAPGMHRVCVYAIDREVSSANTPFGCRDVAVGLARPVGSWDTLSASGTTLSLSGWTFDPDSPTAPVAVHVYVDGAGVALRADGDRPDVGGAFPHAGPVHGFGWSGQVAPGAHRVCVYAIDQEVSSANTSFGCRDVTV
ncbi:MULTISPECIES: hypothetical protein [unclassified Blastococcus]